MTPERWQQIEQLYHSALERDALKRAAYLQQACAGDDELRQEVESLLAHGKATDGWSRDSALGQMAANALGPGDGHSLPGRQLGSFQILSLLGAGGMGEVYEARDTKLGRNVAIKILPRDFTHDPERLTRFQREAKMLASLNHPNIATIHGLEQSEGVHYLVMELVPGQTLAERIAKGALPLEVALNVAGQIAEALEAAHESGVIHRDLKPANVKVTPEGRVKVLDFGLAKAFARDGGDDLSNMATLTEAGTEDGRILGTPSYMSPEQARGNPVDKRTDIWAFGCVLYEMLAGKQAFRGETLTDTLAAVIEREPNWQALPAATPGKIRDLLGRCLLKDSRRRLRDLGEARVAIDGVSSPVQLRWHKKAAIGVVAGVLITTLAAGVWYYGVSGRSGQVIDSLAVLPFVNASGNPNSEYLSDGITESVIDSLAQLPNLKVMSRDTSFRYKGKDPDAEAVGRELSVRGVFKGRITEVGDSLVISAELVDSRDDSHVWGQQYNRKSSDLLALQGEIATEVTAALRLRLTSEDEKRLAKTYTANSEAYQMG